MTHDTSKDPRILVAQRACGLLKQSLQQKSHVKMPGAKEKLLEMASATESALMIAMYSYLEPDQLAASDSVSQVVETARSMADTLEPVLSGTGPPPLLQANLRWCLRTLTGLAARIGNPGSTLASGVDLVAVEVKNVARTGQLWLTRVSDGRTEYPVVTNIAGVRAHDTMAVAFLPPREVGGELSEAMYLGDEKRSETPGTMLTEAEVDAREAASIVHDEIGKH